MFQAFRHWGVDGGSARVRLLGLLLAVVGAIAAAVALPRLPQDWHLKILAPGWMPHQLVKLIEYSNDLQVALVADRPPEPHPRIALVLIREETLADLPYVSPIDRALLARLVRAIDGLGARAIGIDLLFDQATEPDKDRAFLDALGSRRADIVLGGGDERTPMNPRRRAWQDSFLDKSGKPFGFFNLRYDVREAEQSNVVRARAAARPESRYTRSFAEATAASVGAPAGPSSRRIPWLAPPRGGGDTFITLDADTILLAEADPQGALAHAIEAQLDGRIVLVGADLDGRDRHPTPLTLVTGEEMLGVAVHAQILAGLLDGRSIEDIGTVGHAVLGFAAAFLGVLAGWFAARSRLVLSALVATGVSLIIATSAITLWQSQEIVPLAALAATLAAGAVAGRFGRRWLGG